MYKYFLILFFVFSFVCEANNDFLKQYDPELPYTYKGSLLNYKNMANKVWLLGVVKKMNNYVKKQPNEICAYKIRNYMMQSIFDLTKSKSEKVKIADIATRYNVDVLKIFPGNAMFKTWYTLFFTESYLYKDKQSILNKAPVIVKFLSESVDSNPKCCLTLPAFLLGAFYGKLPAFPTSVGDYNKAVTVLKDAINNTPGSIINYLQLSEIYYLNGKFNKALEMLDLAEKIKPITFVEYFDNVAFKDGIPFFRKEIISRTWTSERNLFEEIKALKK